MTEIKSDSRECILSISWDNSQETQESGEQRFVLRYDEKKEGYVNLIPHSDQINVPTSNFAEALWELVNNGFEGMPSKLEYPLKVLVVKRTGMSDITVSADESYHSILEKLARRSRII